MVILHGHGEHSGRYDKFQKVFEPLHLQFAIYDARGHGRSEGPEVYVDSFEEFIRDVSAFLDVLKAKHGMDKPVILLGHSNGGLVAVHWAFRNPERLKMLILSSPCLGLRLNPFLLGIHRLFHICSPRFVYGSPVYPPHLTHNPEEIKKYKTDPLIRRKISVQYLDQMLLYGSKVDQIDVSRTPFPVHVLAAGKEKVVDLKKTIRFFESIQAPQKSLKVFEGFYHEIFNELDQDQVFERLASILR